MEALLNNFMPAVIFVMSSEETTAGLFFGGGGDLKYWFSAKTRAFHHNRIVKHGFGSIV